MLLRAFSACWTALFAVLILIRMATAVNFEINYDGLALAGLTFGLGMLLTDIAKS